MTKKQLKKSLLKKLRENKHEEITQEEWDVYDEYIIKKGEEYHKEKYGKDWESSISNRVISLWERLQKKWKDK